MEEIIIRLVQFPSAKIKGAVKKDTDGNYNIYLNASLNCEQQQQTALHELMHILRGHLEKDIPVGQAEKEAGGDS